MIDDQEYKSLLRDVEDTKRKRDQAGGRLMSAMDRLKDEFEVSSISEAKTKLKKLNKLATAHEKAYCTELDAFKAEWGANLEH